MGKSKLMLIEGIPGAGKSTTAQRVKKVLDEKGRYSELYLESDWCNPTDLAWVSLLDQNCYRKLLEEFGEYEKLVGDYSEDFCGYKLIYYQKMRAGSGVELPEEMMDYLSKQEPYDGKIACDDFCRLIRSRYQQYVEKGEKSNRPVILESSYFQNQVNELLLFHGMDKSGIIAHLANLADICQPLEPVLVYLDATDVRKTVSKVAEERRSHDREKYPDWIDGIAGYLSNTRFGRENGLSGFEGVVQYFSHRREIELEALDRIGMRHVRLEAYDYDTGMIAELLDA